MNLVLESYWIAIEFALNLLHSVEKLVKISMTRPC